VIEIRFEGVVKGVGLPPPNVIVPAVLEKAGSVVHKEKAEPVLLILTTESTVGLNLSVDSTALILSVLGTARKVTVKVCPAVYDPVLGASERSAAKVVPMSNKKNIAVANNSFVIWA